MNENDPVNKNIIQIIKPEEKTIQWHQNDVKILFLNVPHIH